MGKPTSTSAPSMMKPRQQRCIDALYARSHKGQPPVKANDLTLVVGLGIQNDYHAHPLSPRQILIIATDTYSHFQLEDGSLRENILLADHGYDGEQLQSGDTLSVGDDGGAELRITFQCEPCGKLNKLGPNLCRTIKGQRGYLARVVSSGIVRAGDPLRLTKSVYPPFSEDWHERVINVAHLLPPDHFLSYTKLALLAGVANSYCRAFPRLLDSHNELPLERILAASARPPTHLQEWNGQEVFKPEPLSYSHPLSVTPLQPPIKGFECT